MSAETSQLIVRRCRVASGGEGCCACAGEAFERFAQIHDVVPRPSTTAATRRRDSRRPPTQQPLLSRTQTLEGLNLLRDARLAKDTRDGRVDVAVFVLILTNEHEYRHFVVLSALHTRAPSHVGTRRGTPTAWDHGELPLRSDPYPYFCRGFSSTSRDCTQNSLRPAPALNCAIFLASVTARCRAPPPTIQHRSTAFWQPRPHHVLGALAAAHRHALEVNSARHGKRSSNLLRLPSADFAGTLHLEFRKFRDSAAESDAVLIYRTIVLSD